mmetsp:Transcript_57425/g.151235  ORF Transcript_57425/g.151235 Transcript_57425/m.151235 type:complete len:84 (-) Transcript_57425:558-809(-)
MGRQSTRDGGARGKEGGAVWGQHYAKAEPAALSVAMGFHAAWAAARGLYCGGSFRFHSVRGCLKTFSCSESKGSHGSSTKLAL